jgi:DNA ligase 1
MTLGIGETTEIQGSGATPYKIKNVDGHIWSCTCPAWRNFKGKVNQKTCKHLRVVNPNEAARIAAASGQAPVLVLASPTAVVAQIAAPTPLVTPVATGLTAEQRIAQVRARPGANQYFEPIREPERSQIVASEESRLGRKLRPDEKTNLFGPPVLLAHHYEDYADSLDVTGWWLSEKLDGCRAIWTGTDFISRQGNVFDAPDWFKAGLPSHPLDGELWIGRRKFQQTISVVTSGSAGERWKDVKYLVFDQPARKTSFEQCMVDLTAWYASAQAPYAQVHSQTRCISAQHLQNELDRLVGLGAEGVMVRKPGSLYEAKRSATLLKVKPWKDAEAEVVGYEAGKAANKGVTGGLILKMPDGKTFHIGSLTAKQRRQPPPVGTQLTYRYMEVTDDGIPKGASIVAIRDYE